MFVFEEGTLDKRFHDDPAAGKKMDWKESYHSLRSEHSELQRKYHERTEELKRTNVQLSKIENLMRVKERLDENTPREAQREEDRQSEINRDQRRLLLEKRCRGYVAELEKRKREVAVLKRAARSATTLKKRQPLATAATTCNANVNELVSRLKCRLEEAEAQLERVSVENRTLRETARNAAGRLCRNSSPVDEAADSLAPTGGTNRPDIEAQADVQMLRLRYDSLETKFKSQSELQQKTFQKLEEYNEEIRDLRNTLGRVQMEKADAEDRASRLDDMMERVSLLRETNRNLEDEITKLCQSPFVNEAAEHLRRDRAERDKLQREVNEEQKKLRESEQARSRQAREIEDLKCALERATGDKRDADQLIDKLKQSRKSEDVKQNLPRGDDAVNVDELEEALAIVRMRRCEEQDGDKYFDFLPYPPTNDAKLSALELREKIELIRNQYLESKAEVERAEKMLKIQMSINKDLHLEIEALQSKQSDRNKELEEKAHDLEALTVRRLHKINSLEAQLKQRHTSSSSATNAALGALREDSTNQALLAECADDLTSDENLVEVWLVNCEYSEIHDSTNSTFGVVDFYNFESQATQWLPGSKPEFDFATSFKVKVDDVFLRYLATETLVLEICQANQTDYDVLGRAEVPLAPLLDSRPTLVVDRLELRVKRTDHVFGYARLEIRLARPLTDLYQLFLDRHPKERADIEKNMLEQLDVRQAPSLVSQTTRTTNRLSNEIQITIQSAAGLSLRENGDPPSTYVHYQLLQFEDTFTPVCSNTIDPVYDHSLSFPLATTAQSLAVLRTERLLFTVLDFKGDDEYEEDLIGTCEANLSPLADGDRIFVTLPLKSQLTGRTVGAIRVAIKWVNDLKRDTEDAPNSLNRDELAWIMAEFSPQKIGQVDYLSFLHAFDEPPHIAQALAKLRTCVEKSELTRGKGPQELFGQHRCEDLSEEEIADLVMKALGRSGLKREELCCLVRFARVINPEHFDLIKLSTVPNSFEVSLRSKVGGHLEAMRRQGYDVVSSFESLDPVGSGRLPRPEFKRALRSVGFELLDEPEIQPRQFCVDKDDDAQLPKGLAIEEGHKSFQEGSKQREFEDRLLRQTTSTMRATSPPAEAPAPPLTKTPRSPSPPRVEALNSPRSPSPEPVLTVEDIQSSPRAEFTRPEHVVSIKQRALAVPEEELPCPEEPYADADVLRCGPIRDAPLRKDSATILEADESLAGSLGDIDWLDPCRESFAGMDRDGSGLIQRKQFAWVLKQHAPKGVHINGFLSHFSTGADGMVSYRHFMRFVENRQPLVSAAVSCARRLIVHDGVVEAARIVARGADSLPVEVFAQAMRVSGCELEGPELESIVDIFPPATKNEATTTACVDFESFLGFCLEQPASTRYRELRQELRRSVSSGSAREAFRRYDSRGRAELGKEDFERLVTSVLVGSSKVEVRALTASFFENGSRGLSFDDFHAKLQAGPQQQQRAVLPKPPNWKHLRTRCRAACRERSSRVGTESGAKQTLAQFTRYDWRGADLCTVDVFVAAATRAGFGLTKAELAVLGNRFCKDDDDDESPSRCQYVKFVSWASSDASNNMIPLAAKLLVAASSRWWQVFEDRDRSDSRRLHVDDFVSCLEKIFGEDAHRIRAGSLAQSYLDEQGLVVYHEFISAVEEQRERYRLENVDENRNDRSMSQLREALKEWMADGVDFRSLFDDKASRGTLSPEEFHEILDGRLSVSESEELIAKFKGRYVELLHAAVPYVAGEPDYCWRNEERLRSMVRRKFEWWVPGGLVRAFRHFDTKNAGCIGESELADGLRALKMKLPSHEERDLFRRIDLDNDGTVSCCDFVVFVRDPYYPYLERKVRRELARTRPSTSSLETCRRALTRRDGSLREFGTALARLDLDLSASEVRRLATRFDERDDGRISADRFLMFLQGRSEKDASELRVSRLQRVVRRAFSGRSPRRVFEELDVDGSGFVSRLELRDALERLGIDEEVDALLERFDRNGDGKIDYGEFETFVVDGGGEEVTEKDLDELLAELQRRASSSTELAFDQFDSDGSGDIDADELKLGVKRFLGGYELSTYELKKLADRFGSDNGRIRYEDFVAALKPFESAVAKIKRRKDDFLLALRQCDDREDDAWLSRSDAARAFGGFLDDPADVRLVCDRLADSRGRVSMRELQEMFGGDGRSSSGDALETVVRRRVKALERRGKSLLSIFRSIDSDASGKISRREFGRELEALGLSGLSKKDVSGLIDRFDKDGDGKISYREFVEFAEDGAQLGEDDLSALLSRLRGAVERKKLSVAEAFERFDLDDSGSIDADELQIGVKKLLGLELTAHETKKLMEKFGVGGKKLRYKQFADEISSSSSSSLLRLKTDIRRLAQRHSYAKVFAAFDVDSDGKISRRELKRGLDDLGGFDLSASQVKRLCDEHLDRDGDGKVSFQEFLDFAGVYTEDRISRIQRAIRQHARDLGEELFRGDERDVVTRHDFRRSIDKMFGVVLSESDLDSLVDRFDCNDDGKIDWKEFVRFAKTGHRVVEETDVDELVERFADAADDLESAFLRLDLDGDGHLDRGEIQRGVKKLLGVTLSSFEADKLIERFPTAARQGRVDYRAFVDAMREQKRSRRRRRSPRSRRQRRRRSPSRHRGDDDLLFSEDEVTEALRDELKRLAGGKKKRGSSCERLFREFDLDGSGRIDRSEFKRALRDIGGFANDRVDDLMDKLDTNRSGKISLKEFRAFVDDDSSALGRVKSLIRRAIKEDGRGAILDTFAKYDTRGKGELDEESFSRALKRLGIVLAKYEHKALFGKRRCIDYKKFIRRL